PIGICLNIPLEFDHSASDSDGDDLVYELCTPFQGGTQFTPAPNPPSGPPFQNVVYAGGYSSTNPIDAMPGLAINESTGLLTGIPTQIGQYVIGICVKEYRDGQLLSEVRRDFQFNVTNCPDVNVASIASQVVDTECNGLTIMFDNQSQNANSYLWLFGDGNSSTNFEPTYTYSNPGTYEVTLISDPGEVCADTSIQVFSIFDPIEPVVGVPELSCESGGPLYSIDMSSNGLITQTDWDFDGGTGDVNALSPQDVFFPPGATYNISLEAIDENDCPSNASIQLTVPPQPEAAILNNNQPCSGFEITFINQSDNSTSFEWDFGLPGDADVSFEESPIFIYPESGDYEATLYASSQGTCPDTAYLTINVTPNIYADFEIPDGQCFENNSFDFLAQGFFGDNATLTWNFQNANIESYEGTSPPAIQFNSFGQNLVTLTAFQEGCETEFDALVNVVPNPEADFLFTGDGCSPMVTAFSNLSFGGSSPTYHWDFGDGNTSSGQSPVNVYVDAGVYSVSLLVTSSGDCIDTSFIHYPNLINVDPSPEASFFISDHQVDILDPSIEVTAEHSNPLWSCEYWVSDSTSYQDCFFEHEFDSPGNYTVLMTVINEFGCESRAIQDVLVTGSLFWAPNAITMNGDGLNDFFKPIVLGAEEYELIVFDRWGQEMFSSSDPNEAWIPEYAHPGIYVFKAMVKEAGTLVHEYTGHFTLIR
ncbi:MAG: PKD domain-containing protein, partial [Bacteroidota bacterium]